MWEMFQQKGIAPRDMEYEDAPRGRVVYNTKTQRFMLLADRCILRNETVVRKIMAEMNLPSKSTDRDTDSHYRCLACLLGESEATW
jgi:hypothetical protein